MSYAASGAVDLTTSASYRMVNGVAVPQDTATLELFQTIQRVLNALLAFSGQSLIGVDGRIGNATTSALESLQTSATPLDPEIVADTANTLLTSLYNQQSSTGAPNVADPPVEKPSYAQGGKVMNPPDGEIKNQMSTTTWILIAVGVGVAIALFTGKKKRR